MKIALIDGTTKLEVELDGSFGSSYEEINARRFQMLAEITKRFCEILRARDCEKREVTT